MDAPTLSATAAAVLALVFGYAPGLKDWYDPLPPIQKAQIMGLALAVVAAGAFVLGCLWPTLLPAGWVIACNQQSAGELIKVAFAALGTNVGTYVLLVKPTKA